MTVSFTLAQPIQLFVEGRIITLGSGNHEIDEEGELQVFEQLRRLPREVFNIEPLLPGEMALPASPDADLVYVGTFAQVDEANTAALLGSAHAAIWCPPHRLIPWHGTPRAGSRVWLTWRANGPGDPLTLLGGGRLRSVLMFNNATLPGVRPFATNLGYPAQPTNMTFLQLVTPTVLAPGTFLPVPGVDPPHNGLNDLAPGDAAILSGLLPIP